MTQRLTTHVDHLRALEGEWRFDALQVDGNDMPAAMLSHSKLLMDGDRFRMESPEAIYDGHFTIDASATPMQIDIAFVEGPEAGHHSYGLFELQGDRVTICLGLVGASRPTSFATRPGSGHALERLRRTSSTRPADVNGGVAPASHAADVEPPRRSANAPDPLAEASPMLDRLQGEWRPVRLVMGGKEMPAQWLQHGSRTGTGDEVKVVFGGQVMLHAKMRIDHTTKPIAIDYTLVHGPSSGMVSLGLMEWVGEEVRFLMAAPGQERPADFSSVSGAGLTFSQWERAAHGTVAPRQQMR